VPIARRSAIHPTVIVVSARKRAAKATFTESPFRPSFQISFLPPRPSFNSVAMISSASASAVVSDGVKTNKTGRFKKH
jgi:hypothetical protein